MEYYSSTLLLLLLFSPRQSHKSCWHSHIHLIMYRSSEIYGKNSEKCHNRPTTSSITWSIPQPQQQGVKATTRLSLSVCMHTHLPAGHSSLYSSATERQQRKIRTSLLDRSIDRFEKAPLQTRMTN